MFATNPTLDKWMNRSREELDEVYRSSPPGALPTGDTRGTAIVTGSFFPRTLARLARLLAWQGKVFDLYASDAQAGVLVNKVLPLGLGLIVAKVYRGTSWLDGRDTIVIDYGHTSLLARAIRDEIREVEPGLWLGKVWWGRTRVLDFALSAPPGVRDTAPAVDPAVRREAAETAAPTTRAETPAPPPGKAGAGEAEHA